MEYSTYIGKHSQDLEYKDYLVVLDKDSKTPKAVKFYLKFLKAITKDKEKKRKNKKGHYRHSVKSPEGILGIRLDRRIKLL